MVVAGSETLDSGALGLCSQAHCAAHEKQETTRTLGGCCWA